MRRQRVNMFVVATVRAVAEPTAVRAEAPKLVGAVVALPGADHMAIFLSRKAGCRKVACPPSVITAGSGRLASRLA
jgi:hypothetical protein